MFLKGSKGLIQFIVCAITTMIHTWSSFQNLSTGTKMLQSHAILVTQMDADAPLVTANAILPALMDVGPPLAIANATIVTAYFEFPSKHPSTEYQRWMRNMLSLQDAMVIYTSPSLVSTMEGLRAHAIERTLVVPMELNDTRMARSYNETFWLNQSIMDPERNLHPDVRLYWIWDEKSEFLKQTVDQNPFNSSYFAWVDIGYFRDEKYNGKTMLQRLPPPSDRIILLEAMEAYVGGGFIGGYIEGIKRWHAKFYQMLDEHKQEFIGKDQTWMRKTCDTNPGLCDFVAPDNEHGNSWF